MFVRWVAVQQPARPLRVDAARNRSLLLAAAEDEFAERGLSASVADIARRAGVAKGTLFRHFVSKDDLIVAVVSEHIAALTRVARSLTQAPDPGAALFEFLSVAAERRQQRNLTFLQSVGEGDPRVVAVRDELLASIGALVDRGHEAGALRPDVTVIDVFLLLCAPVHVVENLPEPPPDLWQRYLAIIFDGLRPVGASPLPQPPPQLPRA